jgi:4-hydroxymandelate oxidase
MTAVDARWLESLEGEAERVLPPAVFRYVRQGARDGLSAAEAVIAWRQHRFAPHVLRDVTTIDTATTVLGTPLRAPVAIAPTTLQRMVHPDGELAMARATADAGSLMVVSSNAGTRFAEIAGTGVRWWLQAYLPQDRGLARDLLASAVAAGAEAVVLTLDTPVVGTKYDDGPAIWDDVPGDSLRVNFPAGYDDAPGSAKATDLGSADIAWLRETTGLPVVVKGVLRPDDARRCEQAGAAAVWVSNHGGRQLDRSLSTAAALPGVVSALDGTTEVYVDGGVRTGLDVLSAVALGARCAFLGRMAVWALVGGTHGVGEMHRRLWLELQEAMRLAGTPSLAATRQLVVSAPRGTV